jgi:hypothetical protein
MRVLVAYAANTGRLPDDLALPSDARWSMTDAPDLPAEPGATSATLQPDGVLRITDPEKERRRIYARYDPVDETDDAVFEVSCRVVSAGDSYGVVFGLIDTRKSIEVALFENQVALYLVDAEATAAVKTGDALHTYRIEKTGAATVHVSVDGTVVLGVAYEALADRTQEFPAYQRQVLATSAAETSEWEIAYACYSIWPSAAPSTGSGSSHSELAV